MENVSIENIFSFIFEIPTKNLFGEIERNQVKQLDQDIIWIQTRLTDIEQAWNDKVDPVVIKYEQHTKTDTTTCNKHIHNCKDLEIETNCCPKKRTILNNPSQVYGILGHLNKISRVFSFAQTLRKDSGFLLIIIY